MPVREYVLRLVVVLTIAGCTSGCSSKQDEQASAPPVVAVKTSPVRKGNVEVVVTAVGRTEALRKLKVFSPIAGRVVSSKVLEGMQIEKGDVLAAIQTKESLSAIAGAEELVRSARTPDERNEALRTLQLAEASEKKVNVYARFRGVVAARNVTEGELVAENAELLSMVDPSTIVFVADVPLRDVPSLKTGQRGSVQFSTLPGRNVQAVVDAISPESDIQTQAVRVRLRLTGQQWMTQSELKTDMMGTARVVTGTHMNVLTVPKAALLRDDETNTYSVVTVTPDSLAINVIVRVGTLTDSTAEVISDALREGARVVVEGNYALSDSTRLRVVDVR